MSGAPRSRSSTYVCSPRDLFLCLLVATLTAKHNVGNGTTRSFVGSRSWRWNTPMEQQRPVKIAMPAASQLQEMPVTGDLLIRETSRRIDWRRDHDAFGSPRRHNKAAR